MRAKRRAASDAAAYLMLTATAMCWAGNHVVGRWIAAPDMTPVPPGGLSTLRWLLATLVLLPFAWRHVVADWPRIMERRWIVLFLGLLGGTTFTVMQYYGLRYTTAVNVSVLNSVTPAAIIVAGVLLFRDAVHAPQVAGIGVSLVGVLVIMAHGELAQLLGLTFNRGDVLVCINMVLFAIFSTCLRLRPELHWLTFTTVMSAVACIGSIPAMLVETAIGEPVRATWPTVIAIVYTGLFTSVVAYLAWNTGVSILGPQRAGAFLHLVPVFGALLSMLFLGEEPRPFHAVGLLLIITGVTLAARKPPAPA